MTKIYLSSWDKLIILLTFLGIIFYLNSVVAPKKTASINNTPKPAVTSTNQTLQTQTPAIKPSGSPTPSTTHYSIQRNGAGEGEGGFGGDN